MLLPIRVINLRSATGRWEDVGKALDAAGLPHTRFEAVDGDDLAREQLERYTGGNDNWRWLRGLSRREIGCYLSHLQLWEEVSKGPRGGAFIFEDDVTPLPGLSDVLEMLSRADADGPPVLVKLGDDHRDSRRVIGRRALGGGYTLLSYWRIPWGLGAYYVNRRTAARLAERRRTFFRTADDDLRHHWETGVDVEEVSPPVIRHPAPDTDSDIGGAREATRVRRRRTWKGRLVARAWAEHFKALNAVHLPRRMLRMRKSPRG